MLAERIAGIFRKPHQVDSRKEALKAYLDDVERNNIPVPSDCKDPSIRTIERYKLSARVRNFWPSEEDNRCLTERSAIVRFSAKVPDGIEVIDEGWFKTSYRDL